MTLIYCRYKSIERLRPNAQTLSVLSGDSIDSTTSLPSSSFESTTLNSPKTTINIISSETPGSLEQTTSSLTTKAESIPVTIVTRAGGLTTKSGTQVSSTIQTPIPDDAVTKSTQRPYPFTKRLYQSQVSFRDSSNRVKNYNVDNSSTIVEQSNIEQVTESLQKVENDTKINRVRSRGRFRLRASTESPLDESTYSSTVPRVTPVRRFRPRLTTPSESEYYEDQTRKSVEQIERKHRPQYLTDLSSLTAFDFGGNHGSFNPNHRGRNAGRRPRPSTIKPENHNEKIDFIVDEKSSSRIENRPKNFVRSTTANSISDVDVSAGNIGVRKPIKPFFIGKFSTVKPNTVDYEYNKNSKLRDDKSIDDYNLDTSVLSTTARNIGFRVRLLKNQSTSTEKDLDLKELDTNSSQNKEPIIFLNNSSSTETEDGSKTNTNGNNRYKLIRRIKPNTKIANTNDDESKQNVNEEVVTNGNGLNRRRFRINASNNIKPTSGEARDFLYNQNSNSQNENKLQIKVLRTRNFGRGDRVASTTEDSQSISSEDSVKNNQRSRFSSNANSRNNLASEHEERARDIEVGRFRPGSIVTDYNKYKTLNRNGSQNVEPEVEDGQSKIDEIGTESNSNSTKANDNVSEESNTANKSTLFNDEEIIENSANSYYKSNSEEQEEKDDNIMESIFVNTTTYDYQDNSTETSSFGTDIDDDITIPNAAVEYDENNTNTYEETTTVFDLEESFSNKPLKEVATDVTIEDTIITETEASSQNIPTESIKLNQETTTSTVATVILEKSRRRGRPTIAVTSTTTTERAQENRSRTRSRGRITYINTLNSRNENKNEETYNSRSQIHLLRTRNRGTPKNEEIPKVDIDNQEKIKPVDESEISGEIIDEDEKGDTNGNKHYSDKSEEDIASIEVEESSENDDLTLKLTTEPTLTTSYIDMASDAKMITELSEQNNTTDDVESTESILFEEKQESSDNNTESTSEPKLLSVELNNTEDSSNAKIDSDTDAPTTPLPENENVDIGSEKININITETMTTPLVTTTKTTGYRQKYNSQRRGNTDKRPSFADKDEEKRKLLPTLFDLQEQNKLNFTSNEARDSNPLRSNNFRLKLSRTNRPTLSIYRGDRNLSSKSNSSLERTRNSLLNNVQKTYVGSRNTNRTKFGISKTVLSKNITEDNSSITLEEKHVDDSVEQSNLTVSVDGDLEHDTNNNINLNITAMDNLEIINNKTSNEGIELLTNAEVELNSTITDNNETITLQGRKVPNLDNSSGDNKVQESGENNQQRRRKIIRRLRPTPRAFTGDLEDKVDSSDSLENNISRRRKVILRLPSSTQNNNNDEETVVSEKPRYRKIIRKYKPKASDDDVIIRFDDKNVEADSDNDIIIRFKSPENDSIKTNDDELPNKAILNNLDRATLYQMKLHPVVVPVTARINEEEDDDLEVTTIANTEEDETESTTETVNEISDSTEAIEEVGTLEPESSTTSTTTEVTPSTPQYINRLLAVRKPAYKPPKRVSTTPIPSTTTNVSKQPRNYQRKYFKYSEKSSVTPDDVKTINIEEFPGIEPVTVAPNRFFALKDRKFGKDTFVSSKQEDEEELLDDYVEDEEPQIKTKPLIYTLLERTSTETPKELNIDEYVDDNQEPNNDFFNKHKTDELYEDTYDDESVEEYDENQDKTEEEPSKPLLRYPISAAKKGDIPLYTPKSTTSRYYNRPSTKEFVHPASLRTTAVPKYTVDLHTEPSPLLSRTTEFIHPASRAYTRKYTITTTTTEARLDSGLEDLNIDALNARNKKIFDSHKKPLTTKPSTTQIPPSGFEISEQPQFIINVLNSSLDDNLIKYSAEEISHTENPIKSQINHQNNIVITEVTSFNASSYSSFDSQNSSVETTENPSTYPHHIFAVDSSTEDQTTEEDLGTVTTEKLEKLLEINLISEVKSKEEKLKLSNVTYDSKPVVLVSSSDIQSEQMPKLDKRTEINRLTLIKVVNGETVTTDIPATDSTVYENSSEVSAEKSRAIDFNKQNHLNNHLFVEPFTSSTERSTITLEGLFKNEEYLLRKSSDGPKSSRPMPVYIPSTTQAYTTPTYETTTKASQEQVNQESTGSVKEITPPDSSPIVISIFNLDKVLLQKGPPVKIEKVHAKVRTLSDPELNIDVDSHVTLISPRPIVHKETSYSESQSSMRILRKHLKKHISDPGKQFSTVKDDKGLEKVSFTVLNEPQPVVRSIEVNSGPSIPSTQTKIEKTVITT